MESLNNKVPLAVIGAGISGLTAAYRLHSLGHPIQVYDSNGQVGGSIISFRDGPWLHEAGPNTLINNSPTMSSLLSEIGLLDKRLPADPAAKKRFIIRNGTPHNAPGFFSNKLFSTRAKLGAFRDLFHKRQTRPADIPLSELFLDHFNQELLDYALNPLVSGIYAGTPEKLSGQYAFPLLWQIEQTQGSFIRGLMAYLRQKKRDNKNAFQAPLPSRMYSFEEGLQQIPRTLAEKLPPESLSLNTTLKKLTFDSERQWTLHLERNGEAFTQNASSVVFAIQPHALATLEIQSNGKIERPLSSLGLMDSPPVTSILLGYHRSQIKHPLDGFGLLAPQKENRHFLGVLFSSSLFSNRAPKDHHAITVMVGGMRSPELAHLPSEKLMPLISPELSTALGIKGNPVYIHSHTTSHAIPQYNLGYEKHLSVLQNCEKRYPGLHVLGNLRGGISVSSCAQNAGLLAERLRHFN